MHRVEANVLPLEAPELPLLDRPRQKTFREAVARVIRELKAAKGLSNVELAEEIGCCADTVSNAENMNNDLKAVLLLAIAWRFGETAIAPVRALYLRECPAKPRLADLLDLAARELRGLA